MKTVDIKVNVSNRLQKICQGVVYDDMTAIGEFIQNCQRSLKKSDKEDKVIDVVINEKVLVIRDNGVGCDTPETIFEFETSGWGLDHAFGQGGSESVFRVADIFEIYSHNWKVRCNVKSILKSKQPKVMPKEAKYLDGYQLTIRGKFVIENHEKIEEFLRDLLCHLEYTCFINGKRVEYVDIQDFDAPNFKMKFDNEMYSGTLAVQRSTRYTQAYFEKRKVKDLWENGIFGVIELKDGVVDLKAPDRKDIIWNSKYMNLEHQIETDTKELYKQAIKKFAEEDFEAYGSEIMQILTPEEYVQYLPYAEVSTELALKEGFGLDNKIVPVSITQGSSGGTVTEEKSAKPAVTSTKEVIAVSDKFTVITKEDEQPTEKLQDKVKTIINAVWVESSKAIEYEKELRMAAEYGLKILYAKNKLYEEAFKYLKKVHISEFITKSEEVYVIEPAQEYEPSKVLITGRSISKEERVMRVLKLIEKNYELGETFSIGNVERKLKLGEIDTKASKTPVAVLKKEGRIILDKDSLVLDAFDLETSYDAITRFDILVVMANIQAIAGGLSQLMLNTIPDTVEHYNSVQKYTKELAIILNNNIIF